MSSERAGQEVRTTDGVLTMETVGWWISSLDRRDPSEEWKDGGLTPVGHPRTDD